MKKQYNVAIIGGAGFMGRAHSLELALAQQWGEDTFAIRKHILVDATEESAARAADLQGWSSSSADWRTVIQRPDVDVIDIATPPHMHEEIALAALQANKHVFCEKPITNDTTSARRVAAAARTAGVVTQVGYNYRHTPAIAHIKQLINSGALGRVMQLRGAYLMDYGFFVEDSGWRKQRSSGGSGTVGDIGSHITDIAEYLCGDITRVSALVRTRTGAGDDPWLPEETRLGESLVDEAGVWLAQFASGAVGTFSAGIYSVGRKNQITFELDATKGAAEFNWNRREDINVALLSDGAADTGFKRVVTGNQHPDVWYPVDGLGFGYVDGGAVQFKKFFTAITEGRAAAPDFADAAHVQAVIDAVNESATSGRWVDVEGRI